MGIFSEMAIDDNERESKNRQARKKMISAILKLDSSRTLSELERYDNTQLRGIYGSLVRIYNKKTSDNIEEQKYIDMEEDFGIGKRH